VVRLYALAARKMFIQNREGGEEIDPGLASLNGEQRMKENGPLLGTRGTWNVRKQPF
jgi:hypothetical protein